VRKGLLALVLLLATAGAAACGGGGGDDPEPSSSEAPQSVADAFIAELLDGRPSDAAERLSPIRSELEPQLPGLSIQLQTNGYRVQDVKRRGKKAFVYSFRGNATAQPRTAQWVLTFEEDLGQWGIVTFAPVRRQQPASS
jgi:hypothetical protein